MPNLRKRSLPGAETLFLGACGYSCFLGGHLSWAFCTYLGPGVYSYADADQGLAVEVEQGKSSWSRWLVAGGGSIVREL